MAKKKVFILGAGLAGLSAAYHLQKKGVECQVFEKEEKIGGLCRSKKIDGFTPSQTIDTKGKNKISLTGFTFDYSGHLLHFRHKRVFNFVRSFLGNNLVRHKRNAAIFSFHRFIPFPFQANLSYLPAMIKEECLREFIAACQNRRSNVETFQDWIIHNLGKGIAKHFMIPYNTKFWTIPPQELTSEWVDGFIPVPSLGEIVEGTTEEGKRNLGYNAFFWYPKKGGINELPMALASRVKNIFTNCEVTEIDLKNKKIKLANGSQTRFDFLLSTLPLPELPRLIKGMPREIISLCKKLRWNSIFNLNLGVEKGLNNFHHHWIYFPEEKFSFFRVGFPANFSSSIVPPGKSSLYVEVAYSSKKPIDKKTIVSKTIKDLIEAKIISSSEEICVQDINDIKYGYPIYDFNYKEAREKILDYLRENKIFSFGRYGSWRYMSMEDVLWESEAPRLYSRGIFSHRVP